MKVGHHPDRVPPAEVVVSGDRGRQPGAARRAQAGQAVLHRGDLLAGSAAQRLIAVAGTHGKTTTAGMAAHALAACGRDPRS